MLFFVTTKPNHCILKYLAERVPLKPFALRSYTEITAQLCSTSLPRIRVLNGYPYTRLRACVTEVLLAEILHTFTHT